MKGGGEAGGGDARQLVPRVPAIGGRHPGIRHSAQVAVQIVGLGVGSKCKLLIVGVVTRGREGGGNGGAR